MHHLYCMCAQSRWGKGVLSGRWTETGDLNDNSFITGLCEVIPRGRFGVETAWWEGF